MRKLVLLSVLVVFMLAPLALAADKTVNFYGRAHVGTYITDADKEYADSVVDDSDLTWDGTDFRFGANYTVSEALTAKVEITGHGGVGKGYGPNKADHKHQGHFVQVRHWYGAWQFNDNGTFVVGRTWAPTFQAITDSNIGDGFADVQGSLREDGLQLWYNVGGGSLKIAALTPYLSDPEAWGDQDTSLPKLEVSYNHKIGPVDMNFFGGYNTCDAEENVASGTSSLSVDSFVYGLTAIWEPKPAYVKAAVYFGQNLTEYGWGAPIDNALTVVSWREANTWHLADTDYFAYVLCGGFEMNDRLTFAAGWMHIEMEQDATLGAGNNLGYAAGAYHAEEGSDEYYIMATYKLADNVFMAPEISILDCQDSVFTVNGVDQYAADPTAAVRGSRTNYGIYWMINF